MDSHVVASRRPEKDYVLPPLDEAEGVEALDLVAFDTRLEAEVEVGERLHGRERGGPHGHRAYEQQGIRGVGRGLRGRRHGRRADRPARASLSHRQHRGNRYRIRTHSELQPLLRPSPPPAPTPQRRPRRQEARTP